MAKLLTPGYDVDEVIRRVNEAFESIFDKFTDVREVEVYFGSTILNGEELKAVMVNFDGEVKKA